MVLEPGQVILGQFTVEALIGEGGMATIYRARQHDIDRPVAIKILRAEIASISGVVERMHREARLASRLQSAHVAHVYVTGELPDGRHAMAMELLEGRVLEKVIEEGGALSETRVVHILRQIGDAVAEAHELGIVHRDLKPENIMLVRRGGDEEFVKVLDFGIAKQIGPESSSLTGVGLAIGTPLYMSPEGASGSETTPASDIYSIGVLAYEMLAGELPFDDENPSAVLLKHVNSEPPLLTSKPAASKTTAGLATLVHRCLSKDPARRPQNGRAFLQALDAINEPVALAATTPVGTPIVGLSPALAAAAVTPVPEMPLVLERSLGELEQVDRKSEPVVVPVAASVEATPLPKAPSRPAPARGRGWMTLALVAIAAMVAVAVAMRGPSAEERQDKQLARAERALEKGRYDGPHGAIALAQKVLDESPGHERARELQKNIVKALQRDARTAEQEDRLADALATLRLLESLEPTRNVRARVKRLEKRMAAAAAPREEPEEVVPGARVVALYLQPSKVIAGQRVAIVARTTGPRGALDASSFHVRTATGGAAVLPATRSGDGGTYTTSHTFAEGGRYQVGFAGYWAQITVAEAGDAPTAEAAPEEPTLEPTPAEPAPTPEQAEAAPAPEPAPAEEPEPTEAAPQPTPAPPAEPSPS